MKLFLLNPLTESERPLISAWDLFDFYDMFGGERHLATYLLRRLHDDLMLWLDDGRTRLSQRFRQKGLS